VFAKEKLVKFLFMVESAYYFLHWSVVFLEESLNATKYLREIECDD